MADTAAHPAVSTATADDIFAAVNRLLAAVAALEAWAADAEFHDELPLQ
jgi:hypothetical protein